MPRALSLALACLLLVPAAASARSLKGTVAGSPYVATDTTEAVPVLFSRESAAKAHLGSAVGIVVMPRRGALRSDQGKVLPNALRMGDRFKIRARIPREARKSGYARLAIRKARQFRITKRSKTLSNDELTALLTQTRKQVAALGQYVDGLAAFTRKGFGDLDARLAELDKLIGSLTGDLAGVHAALDGLSAALDAQAQALLAKVGELRDELQPQITALADSLSALAGQLGSCADPASVLGRVCSLESAVSLLSPPNLTALTDRVDQISSALTSVVNGLTGLSLTGDLPATLNGTINTALTGLFGLQTQVSSLTGAVSTAQGQLAVIDGVDGIYGTADDALGQLGALVAGLNVPLLTSTVDGLSTQVGGLIGSLGADSTTGQVSATISSLQSAIGDATNLANTAQSTADGALSGLTSTQATVSALQSTVDGLTPQVAYLCGTALTTLNNDLGLLGAATVSAPLIGTLPLTLTQAVNSIGPCPA